MASTFFSPERRIVYNNKVFVITPNSIFSATAKALGALRMVYAPVTFYYL